MEICLLADTHLGIRNNSDCLLACQEKFYNDIFFPTLEKENIKTIVHLGDYFDNRKNVSHYALAKNEEHFLKPLEKGGYEMIIIAGNHDCFYTSTNKLNSLRTILSTRKNIRIIDNESMILSVDGGKTNSLFVPWLNPENVDVFNKLLREGNFKHIFGHFEINGFEVQRGQVMEHGIDKKLFKDAPIVFSGHFHHKSTLGNIHYLGSPHQATWNDIDSERGFHILDTETLELRFIKNPYDMFKVIKYNNGADIKKEDLVGKYVRIVVEGKEDESAFANTLKEISSFAPENVSVVDEVNTSFTQGEIQLQEGESTIQTIQKYVDALEECVLKDDVKQYINNLYLEALTVL